MKENTDLSILNNRKLFIYAAKRAKVASIYSAKIAKMAAIKTQTSSSFTITQTAEPVAISVSLKFPKQHKCYYKMSAAVHPESSLTVCFPNPLTPCLPPPTPRRLPLPLHPHSSPVPSSIRLGTRYKWYEIMQMCCVVVGELLCYSFQCDRY